MSDRDPTDTGQSSAEPREVAGYRLLRRVADGGMSSVYLSYDVAAGHPVAVKLLADHLSHSREFVNRFYREARLSRLLSHPNLVRGLAAGFDPATAKHYLVLEFIDGPSAHTALAIHGCFPVGAAVKVGIDIARALGFLHARQYVHRDVKPDNILLHPAGSAKLADLGVAKRLSDDPQLTTISQGVGTSYYMAYEQAINSTLVDGRSDIYALGATLYHLLAAEVPFPGSTHEEIIRGKALQRFRPVSDHNPRVPPELARIIAATLARDPRERIQTAGELADALEATGLATPIPTMGEPDAPAGPPTEAPTRADIRYHERRDATPPTLPPSDANYRLPEEPPRSICAPRETATSNTRGLALAVLGVLAGLGLATAVVSAITSRAAHPSPVVPGEPPSENSGQASAGGLPGAIPR